MVTFDSILPSIEKEVFRNASIEAEKNIVLYNDDVNSFDFVIETLIQLCGHNKLQAEQCAYLVHYNGRCAVKQGTYKQLESVCAALLERGLSAKIE